MPVILPSIQLTLVNRLLRNYSNEYGDNWNYYFEGDITLDELGEQLLLLDAAYATKILEAVLE